MPFWKRPLFLVIILPLAVLALVGLIAVLYSRGWQTTDASPPAEDKAAGRAQSHLATATLTELAGDTAALRAEFNERSAQRRLVAIVSST